MKNPSGDFPGEGRVWCFLFFVFFLKHFSSSFVSRTSSKVFF